MTRTKVFITLGSNIDAERNLKSAVRMLSEKLKLVAVSRVYETEPIGAPATPHFLNAAVLVETDSSPMELKYGVLRSIESKLGRVRTSDKNAPRTIDIDIALYGDLVFNDVVHDIRIPDPDILTRHFSLLTLAQLDPDFLHPVVNRSLADILADRPDSKLPKATPFRLHE